MPNQSKGEIKSSNHFFGQ